MWERSMMESFNLDNSYRQKMMFLEQKHASLLYEKSDKRNENFIKRINDALADWDKVEQSDLKKQWLLWILSKIEDTDKLKSVVAMLAKSAKGISNEKSLGEFNTILINSLLADLEEYKQTKNSMKVLEWETTNWYKNSKLFGLISKNISENLKDVLKKWGWFLEEEKTDVEVKLPKWIYTYDEDGNLINEETSIWNDWSSETLSDAVRKNFVNPIAFFHAVQRIYQKYNYVITAEEIWNLKKIFSDIKNGKMVFLTWDTWSGKTELCLLVSHLYLDEIYGESDERKNKKPVLVTWNSETDFSDFTMEKIVTSENYLSTSDDALNKEETSVEKQKEFIDKMNKERQFKIAVKEAINKNTSLTEDEKKEMCEQIDKKNLLEYNIFTKYHLQWMLKAMNEGVPLIIDEMNWIRPEVLLWLNHYFTRKVWQTVSLWNGFSPITIKEWFCIMCTWNDKDENSNAKRYRWRYTIDESLMNRMHRICKWYHKQEIKKFENENASDLRENNDMLDYMTENELYWVVLMLLFSKKENKKINKLWNEEFKKETAAKLLTHTEVTGFDIIKEKFVDMNSNEEKKKAFFGELTKLASFIKLVQDAFQWKTTICDGVDVKTMMENSQWFSMRDLLTIINSYKGDTKSLWYHVYNEYIKMIPENNQAREWIYYIAKEVWFLPSDIAIQWKESEITKDIERNLQREKQTSGKSDNFELMDIHNKKLEISESLLSNGRLIITKQDMYKEYFGDKFSDWIEIDDDKIKQYEEELESQGNNSAEDTENNESDENHEYTPEEIIDTCETILSQKEDEDYENFFGLNGLNFEYTVILTDICEWYQNEDNVNACDQETINKIGKCLSIIENLIMESSTNEDFDIDKAQETILELQSI